MLLPFDVERRVPGKNPRPGPGEEDLFMQAHGRWAPQLVFLCFETLSDLLRLVSLRELKEETSGQSDAEEYRTCLS
ncbi:MAG: hypothetical protein KAH44_05805 [Oricola sp.]|nr:hypothetical protein [Oricola sp.]